MSSRLSPVSTVMPRVGLGSKILQHLLLQVVLKEMLLQKRWHRRLSYIQQTQIRCWSVCFCSSFSCRAAAVATDRGVITDDALQTQTSKNHQRQHVKSVRPGEVQQKLSPNVPSVASFNIKCSFTCCFLMDFIPIMCEMVLLLSTDFTILSGTLINLPEVRGVCEGWIIQTLRGSY